MIKPKYSHKIVKEVNTLKDDDIVCRSQNHFEVKYNVSHVNGKWGCTCYNSMFCKAQDRYCKHILAVMKIVYPAEYELEIAKTVYSGDKKGD